jgi:hypothetical protein
MGASVPSKGDLWVGNPDNRPVERVFIEVTRVAKDESWVDIRCYTWACSWAKRMRCWPPIQTIERAWSSEDLAEQLFDWKCQRIEDGFIADGYEVEHAEGRVIVRQGARIDGDARAEDA